MYTWCILYTFALLLWTCVGHCILFHLNQPKTLIATPDIAWIWKSHEPRERSAASAKNQSVVHEEHKSGHCEELKEDPASHLSSAGILLFLAIHFLCWIVFINLDLAMRSKKHVNKFYRSRLVQSVWVKLPQPCHFRLGPMGLLQITSPLGVLMWHAMRSFHCNRESQDLCGRILADDFSSTGGRRLLSMSESSIGNGSTRFFSSMICLGHHSSRMRWGVDLWSFWFSGFLHSVVCWLQATSVSLPPETSPNAMLHFAKTIAQEESDLSHDDSVSHLYHWMIIYIYNMYNIDWFWLIHSIWVNPLHRFSYKMG